MYLVGVIPGPNKPLVNQINHTLQLVVDNLLEFWDPGVWFSRTANYDLGRLIMAALVPLVADMLAARQVRGIDVAVEAGDGTTLQEAKTPQRSSDEVLHRWLLLIIANPPNLHEQLSGKTCPKAVAWHIHLDNGLR
ncbi:hypothetical protein JAAARDRAFT_50302 [Jaapia argillacea MUCL 33604]|uniref:Uncharacterized protein n=1 Tax=Jaapia argillacea MUCL 33604 TaxID=933084 RepID=A0A067PQ02_9AGAM|nr:hypothetical protein JAAARDRAFT_50302 [Jaapia argillacea MUCL 33604]